MIILNFKKWGQKLCPNLLIKEKSVIQEQPYTLKKIKGLISWHQFTQSSTTRERPQPGLSLNLISDY
jgi:hypothetical protein